MNWRELICLVAGLGFMKCSIDSVNFTNKECPCIEGWECNEDTNLCTKNENVDVSTILDTDDELQFWTEGKVSASATQADSSLKSYRIECQSNSENIFSAIQLFSYDLSIQANSTYSISFRARSSKKYTIPIIRLHKSSPEYNSYSKNDISVTI